MDVRRNDWTFDSYIYELIHIDELYEFNHVERVQNYKNQLLEEMWTRFPNKCAENFVSKPVFA